MGFKTGIVGMPNVGKSTLFNALTKTAAAQAANFPFCTIEPNVGDVSVPDARLDQLAAIAQSNLCAAYAAMGDMDDAKAACDAAIELRADYAPAIANKTALTVKLAEK